MYRNTHTHTTTRKQKLYDETLWNSSAAPSPIITVYSHQQAVQSRSAMHAETWKTHGSHSVWNICAVAAVAIFMVDDEQNDA